MLKEKACIREAKKKQILEESLQEGCILTELAKKHKMSVKTLHGWRTKYKKSQGNNLDSKKNKLSFVEARVDKNSKRMGILQKIDIEFTEFKISVSGKISQETMIKLMSIIG